MALLSETIKIIEEYLLLEIERLEANGAESQHH